MAITFERALELKHGQVIHYYIDSKGKCERWRVNGKVKTWKRNPGKIEIPIKYGLKQCSYLTENLLNQVHLESECPLQISVWETRPLLLDECRDLNISVNQLAKHYKLKTFDTAIPQGLFDRLASEDFNPFGQFVYSYDKHSFGELFPLTVEAAIRMAKVFPEMEIPDFNY